MTRIWISFIACVAVLAHGGSTDAQTKAQFEHKGNKDSAFLILRGTNDNRAPRLSVDGADNTRCFLHLYQDDNLRAQFDMDGFGQDGLILEQSDGQEAVNLAVDNSSNHGLLWLRDATEGVRAVLMVDYDRQGHLVLGSDGSARSTRYVDGQNEGGLRLARSGGSEGAILCIGDGGQGGSLWLHAGDGDSLAQLRVDGAGRTQLSKDGSSNQQSANLYIDGQDQGWLRFRGSGNATGAALWIAGSSSTGALTLHNATGHQRARLRVRSGGRGDLDPDDSGSAQRVSR